MMEKLVMHNGVEVAEGWPEKIAAAQKQTAFKINRRPFKRIPTEVKAMIGAPIGCLAMIAGS
jgi:hypothetical protein